MENTNSWSNASRPFNGYNQTFASQTPAKGSKGSKILFYAGLVFIAGSLVIGGAAFYNYLYGEKTKTYTLTATITDTAEEDGELFSLSEYGLSEEATPEEVENKMIELGLFDPNADYSEGEDADMDSESYCGDGSCNKLALRKEVSVSVGDSVFNGYTEKGANFIREAINFYVSSAYYGKEVSIKKADDAHKLVIQIGKIVLMANISVEEKDTGFDVTKISIYSDDGREVFSSKADYFES